jgi:hypothetical protein
MALTLGIIGGQLRMPDKWGYREKDRRVVDTVLTGTTPPITAEDGFDILLALQGEDSRAMTALRFLVPRTMPGGKAWFSPVNPPRVGDSPAIASPTVYPPRSHSSPQA